MLAGRGVPVDSLEGYAAEPKLDGWRVCVAVESAGVTVRTRHGRDITEKLPEFASLTELGIAAVLDGELVAGTGRALDFYRVGPALATRHRDRSQLAFVAFDLVWLDGADLKMETYGQRRARLEQLELTGVATIVPTWPGTAAACLLGACDEQGVEGIVLKRRTSRYFAGQRSDEWRKLKTRTWITNHAEHRRAR
jgi:bifunctional non-homologous end joining protein LigD